MIDTLFQVSFFLVRAVISVVLVAAGAAKLSDLRSFTTTLAGLGLAIWPISLLRSLSFVISLIELCLGLLLSIGIWSQAISLAVLALFSLFSFVTLIAILKKSVVSCRCFGALSDSQFTLKGLIRSFVLVGFAALIVFSNAVYRQREPEELGLVFLMVTGYIILAFAFAQAAKTLAAIKESLNS